MNSRFKPTRWFCLLLALAGLLLPTASVWAQDEEVAAAAEAVEEAAAFDSYEAFMALPESSFFTISNLWLLIAAGLVFIMHLGFATVETGLTQSKNTVNILFKNTFIVTMGILTYAAWGFAAMYPGDFNGFFAVGSPISGAMDSGDMLGLMTSNYGYPYTVWSDFIFQAMFAATAATIVSGAVAERIKLPGFMVGATLLVMFIYPITGSWEWGGGWLNGVWSGIVGAEFKDFAGSTLVHAFGGFAALAAVLVLGPRHGKYLPGGKIRPILGHSMPLATIGVFMLFLGWFGFNGGSVLSADPYLVSLVFVTTTIAGCAGAMTSIFTSWFVLKKPDHSMALNGILAGLVGITAGADVMGPWSAAIVGAIAGVIVVFAILFFDKIKIDDPVGAISVHGVCGVWGTTAVGIFGGSDFSFIGQLGGSLIVGAFAFISSYIIFTLVKVTMGLRVSEEEEFGGLDVGEHGQEAYPDFAAATKG